MVINAFVYGVKLKLSALLKEMGDEGEYYRSKFLSTSQCIPSKHCRQEAHEKLLEVTKEKRLFV
jgi:hypothetical protein